MKKWLVVLMTVLALCLICSGAMAAEPKTWDLSTYDDFILIRPNDGDTITGSTELNVILSFNDDMTINFENVSIEGGLTSDWDNELPRNVTINLVGSNKVKGPNSTWAVALGVYGSLTIDSIDGTGSLTIESATTHALYVVDYNGTASFTLLNGTVTAIGCSTDSIYGEKYSGVFAEKSIDVKGGKLIASGGYACGTIDEDNNTIPTAVQFNASTHEMTAGTNGISAVATSAYNGEKYMKIAPKANAGGGDPAPQPGAPTAPTAPKTGDESNLALWACLMTLSAIGLVVVGKKFKKAF